MRYKDKTVYVLGCGFAKPLGLPVMSEFVRGGMAILKRVASGNEQKNESPRTGVKGGFPRKSTENQREALQVIDGMLSVLKRRMPMLHLIARRATDQRDEEPTLEDLFSVVELLDDGQGREKKAVKAFIQAVCKFALQNHTREFRRLRKGCFRPRPFRKDMHTPPLVSSELFRGQFTHGAKFFIERTQTVCTYSAFLSQVFADRKLGDEGLVKFSEEKANAIITLNYDMVIEEKVQLLRSSCGRDEESPRETDYRIFYGSDVVAPPHHFRPPRWVASESTEWSNEPAYILPLIKLHGSFNWELVESGDDPRVAVVEPLSSTGAKTGITPIWPSWVRGAMTGIYEKLFKEAVSHLQKASKVVIIGTSLSATDRYLRYLLAEGIGGGEMPSVEIVNYSPGNPEEIRKQWEDNLGRLGELLRPVIFENGFLDYVQRIEE